mmetsp:Transcript_43749/g.93095  ORF Transcript_43749/g.93095 Transcript_43749/m.93095 type:complete len:316 (-) Transcript_43749:1252-2199(-)
MHARRACSPSTRAGHAVPSPNMGRGRTLLEHAAVEYLVRLPRPRLPQLERLEGRADLAVLGLGPRGGEQVRPRALELALRHVRLRAAEERLGVGLVEEEGLGARLDHGRQIAAAQRARGDVDEAAALEEPDGGLGLRLGLRLGGRRDAAVGVDLGVDLEVGWRGAVGGLVLLARLGHGAALEEGRACRLAPRLARPLLLDAHLVLLLGLDEVEQRQLHLHVGRRRGRTTPGRQKRGVGAVCPEVRRGDQVGLASLHLAHGRVNGGEHLAGALGEGPRRGRGHLLHQLAARLQPHAVSDRASGLLVGPLVHVGRLV